MKTIPIYLFLVVAMAFFGCKTSEKTNAKMVSIDSRGV
jgi:hypothetical protein